MASKKVSYSEKQIDGSVDPLDVNRLLEPGCYRKAESLETKWSDTAESSSHRS
jgi:hypothetical protein